MARTAPIKLDQTQKQKEQTKISKWINSESYTKVLQSTMFCMWQHRLWKLVPLLISLACFRFVFDQTLVEQLYCDKDLMHVFCTLENWDSVSLLFFSCISSWTCWERRVWRTYARLVQVKVQQNTFFKGHINLWVLSSLYTMHSVLWTFL